MSIHALARVGEVDGFLVPLGDDQLPASLGDGTEGEFVLAVEIGGDDEQSVVGKFLQPLFEDAFPRSGTEPEILVTDEGEIEVFAEFLMTVQVLGVFGDEIVGCILIAAEAPGRVLDFAVAQVSANESDGLAVVFAPQFPGDLDEGFGFAALATGNVQKLERGIATLVEGRLLEELFKDAVEVFVLQGFKRGSFGWGHEARGKV